MPRTPSLKIVKGLEEFLDGMKKLHSDDIYNILNKAEVKAMTRPRDKIAGMFAGWHGKRDLNQTEAQLETRWRAQKHQPIHPVKESREIIARSIYHNKVKPRNIGNRKTTVWSRIWGATQNSWLIENGRWKDPAAAYNGWNVFKKFFAMNSAEISAKFTAELEARIAKALQKMAAEMNGARR